MERAIVPKHHYAINNVVILKKKLIINKYSYHTLMYIIYIGILYMGIKLSLVMATKIFKKIVFHKNNMFNKLIFKYINIR